MTIDEYLNQLRTLKRESDESYFLVHRIQDQLDAHSSLDIGDGIKVQGSRTNKRENLMLDFSDAVKKSRSADAKFWEIKKQLTENIYKLPYLDGAIIDQVYINNAYFDRDDNLYGLSELLDTSDRATIINKLNAAKEHLKALLIADGVEIE